MKPPRVRDWNKLLGKDVRVPRVEKNLYVTLATGSLCGYETDGSGGISRFRVAWAPADWQDFKAEDVELVAP